MTSRRRFLGASGLAVVSAALGGCDQVPALSRPWRDEQEIALDDSVDGVDEVHHVIERLSYGRRAGDRAHVLSLAADRDEAMARYVERQLAPGHADPAADRAIRRLEALAEPAGELYEYQPAVLRDALTAATLLRAVHGERQLLEVMVDFWSDHFNVDGSKGDCRWLTVAFDRDVIRPYALGRFPDLLRRVILSPAMLWYLDGRVNRAGSTGERPNENHARELLELHTLGVHGGYSQTDVMEVARALSGWSVRSKGSSRFGIGVVDFTADAHDPGAKMVLGREIPAGGGIADVDALVAIVTEHPSCADFIAWKLCQRFIDDRPPASAVSSVARTFRETHGDIAASLRTVFTTPAFRAARQSRLKRPLHFVASALRITDAETDGGPALIEWLQRMGQVPHQYPTPDGYPQDAGPWLGTLHWRWQFAAALVEGQIAGTRVSRAALLRRAGSTERLLTHVLGRALTADERRAADASGNPLALALASPTFQLT